MLISNLKNRSDVINSIEFQIVNLIQTLSEIDHLLLCVRIIES